MLRVAIIIHRAFLLLSPMPPSQKLLTLIIERKFYLSILFRNYVERVIFTDKAGSIRRKTQILETKQVNFVISFIYKQSNLICQCVLNLYTKSLFD